jgi:hypothetical protein
MLDVVETQKILEDYFANVTPEQFVADLKIYCPELLESEATELELEQLEKTKIYQQVKQESQLEIASKLLKKGLTVDYISELLELDASLVK